MESYNDPENTYEDFNFLPNVLKALDEDDDLVIISPEVDVYTDEENFGMILSMLNVFHKK